MSSNKDCPHLKECPMFSLLSRTAKIWQDNYCNDDFARCARYKLSCEGRQAPQLLMPNGKLLKVVK